ncbi:DUF6662 family protein [Hyphococcus sp.]|jgi:hypothetical protein|uniref:DUF6662 family protein n=1 Tax=Hyphococcus sp. TaxID=2038636 RepID=UPI003D146526
MATTNIRRKLVASGIAAAMFSSSVLAAESFLTLTFGVDTLPKGQSEIAFDLTRFHGERLSPYHAITFSGQYERGVGDDTSITIGLGGFSVDHDENAFGANPGAGETPIIPALSEERLSRFSLGAQRRILSPYTDYFGFAVRADFTFDWFEDEFTNTKTKQYSLRPSLLFQKNFLDDTLNVGANLSANFRYGCQKGTVPLSEICQDEIEFRPSIGAAYRFAPKWNIGLEGFYRKRFTDQSDSPGSFYIGPNLHYGDKRWYATASLFWQAAGSAAYVEPTSIQYLSNATRLENETEFRLRVGVNL